MQRRRLRDTEKVERVSGQRKYALRPGDIIHGRATRLEALQTVASWANAVELLKRALAQMKRLC